MSGDTSGSARELAGRNAVVTGASSGIGRAIALELAAAGAQVLVHYRANESGARETVEAIVAAGGAARSVAADLARDEQRERLVNDAWAALGRVDLWVNNAGADVLTGPARHWTFAQKIDQLWQVDVLATMRFTQLAGARMKDESGEPGRAAIVNVGWDQVEQGMAGESGEMFGAIKGAVMAFTRSAARTLAPHVRVNCVAPGWIQTAWGVDAPEYWRRRAVGEALLARWGRPEDVASAVRFLLSPAAGFLTGATLPINGGFRGSRA